MENAVTDPLTLNELAGIFSASTLTTAGDVLIGFIPRLIVAVLFVIAAGLFYRLSRSPIEKVLAVRKFDPELSELLVRNLYKYSLYVFGIILALGQLGIDVTAAIAGVGVIGLALGFAAKDTVANVISGITIFWDKPFEVGELIETAGNIGTVEDITLRSTRIRTQGNQYVIIPNQDIVNTVVINHSMHGPVRIEVPVGIAYHSDIDEARRVLLTMFEGDDRLVYEDDDDRVGDPEVIVKELGDSSVNLEIRFWVEDVTQQFRARVDYTERAKRELDRTGIEIPFPQRQLQISDEVAQRLRNL